MYMLALLFLSPISPHRPKYFLSLCYLLIVTFLCFYLLSLRKNYLFVSSCVHYSSGFIPEIIFSFISNSLLSSYPVSEFFNLNLVYSVGFKIYMCKFLLVCLKQLVITFNCLVILSFWNSFDIWRDIFSAPPGVCVCMWQLTQFCLLLIFVCYQIY